ncbi:phenazine biosynthesis protein [Myxococcota bacterium]
MTEGPDPQNPSSDLDEWVRIVVHWHFHPDTGSPFWLRKTAELDFDPLSDIQTFADLARFPNCAADWGTVSVEDLIPRGCRGDPEAWFEIWETGGTLKAPKRIVDWQDRAAGLRFFNHLLDLHGFPSGGSWLHVGPTGPHLVGKNMRMAARGRGALFHAIDFDPRWVKRCIQAGEDEITRRYIDHIVDQALLVSRSQPVSVVTTTPPVLEALCSHAEGLDWLQQRVRGVIWFGTSTSAETLRLLDEDLLPETVLVGAYGNTLMGIAGQRPRQKDPAGDSQRYPAVFQPYFPYSVVQVVDPADKTREVDWHSSGQVRVTLLGRELFLPNNLERDEAVRVPPMPELAPADGVALVRPLPIANGGTQVTEGVY